MVDAASTNQVDESSAYGRFFRESVAKPYPGPGGRL